MECAKCKVSIFEKNLKRVNEKGEKGIWWCEGCLKKHEPELYKNIKEDETQAERDIVNILN